MNTNRLFFYFEIADLIFVYYIFHELFSSKDAVSWWVNSCISVCYEWFFWLVTPATCQSHGEGAPFLASTWIFSISIKTVLIIPEIMLSIPKLQVLLQGCLFYSLGVTKTVLETLRVFSSKRSQWVLSQKNIR